MTPSAAMLPLAGVRVLEVAQLVSGPYCGTLLAELGAHVTKIEPKHGDMARQFGPFIEEESAYFNAVNRGKQVLRLSLKSGEGRARLHQELQDADILIHNMSSQAASRLGLDAETLRPQYPRLIICAITAFGKAGDSSRVGVDLVFQAESGLMQVTGRPGDGPTRVGTNVPDFFAALSALGGVLAALRARDSGQVAPTVNVSLLRAAVSLQTCWFAAHSAGMAVSKLGNGSPFSAPTGTFPTADREIAISVVNDEQWLRFCHALGASDLLDAPEFVTNDDRCSNRALLDERVAQALRKRPAEDWMKRLQDASIPVGLARDYDEVLDEWRGLFEWRNGVATALPPFEIK